MENNYTIAENFTLPSHGLVYPDKEVNPEIKLRSMTVRDEMRRMAPNNDGTIYRTLAETIDSCMVTKPGISSYDMCIGDFQFLMYKLRTVTYGPEYRIECRCPLCGEQNEYIVSLDDLSLSELKDFDPSEELKVFLPVCKKTVELNINTPRILDNIELDVRKMARQYKRQNKEMSEINWHLLYQLMYSIKTVDGVKLSYTQKETFCNGLVGKDFNLIINKLDALDNKIGLGNLFEVTCPNCGGPIAVSFRLTSEFFRPTPTSQK